MRILHVIPAVAPGGAQVFVKDLAVEQAKNNKVFILALSNVDEGNFELEFKNILSKNNVELYVLNKKLNGDKLAILKQIRKCIKKLNIDIINTHIEETTFHTINATIGLRIPIVQTIHNNKIDYPKLQKYYMNIFLKKYIAISDKVKDSIIDNIGIDNNKIDIVFNGVNINKFANKKRKIRDKVENIISIGRLTEQKNYEELIIAYSMVKKRCEEKEIKVPILNIVGDGELRVDIETKIKENDLAEYVKLLGVREDIPDLLRTCDIYIMPSKWEGLPIVLIEALASGIPIIATDVGSNSEVIMDYDTGVLIKSPRSKDIAECINKVLEDSELRKNISRNCEIKCKDFDISNSSRDYLDIYSNIINRSRRR